MAFLCLASHTTHPHFLSQLKCIISKFTPSLFSWALYVLMQKIMPFCILNLKISVQ